MNELPVESVKLQTSDTQTVNALLIASRGLSPFHWHGQDWGVLTLDHTLGSKVVRAELVPWFVITRESPIVEELQQMLDDPPAVRLPRPAVPPAAPPPAPARHCSCGKPATRGGLCSAEPAAPAIDYRELLIRYIGCTIPTSRFDGLTAVERRQVEALKVEARERYE